MTTAAKQESDIARRILSPERRLRKGRRFGLLTVAGAPFFIRDRQRRTMCVLQCDCGQYTIARADRLFTGVTKSCGCLQGTPLENKEPETSADIKPSPGSKGIEKQVLREFFARSFIQRLVAKGVKRDTIECYRLVLDQAPDFLDQDTVTTWIGTSSGSAATRNRKCRHLLAILRAARRQDLFPGKWLEDIPTAKVTKRVPRAWTQGEFSRLITACESVDGEYFRVPARLWWRSFLLGIWYTGCRVQTMLDAIWENFDARDGTILLESPKDACEILYTLPQDAIAAILAMRAFQTRKPQIWPWPFADRTKTLLRRMRAIIDDAGLPQLREPFHAIRRSVASYITLANGIHAAAEALHHCRPQITSEYYVDPRIVQPKVSAGSIMPTPQTADTGNGKGVTA